MNSTYAVSATGDWIGNAPMIPAAKRQRQLAAKAARRKTVVAGQNRPDQSPSSLSGRIRVAAKGSLICCLMASDMFESGMGSIIVGRALPSGLIGCAYFLLDTFCLGVKDAFYNELTRSELRSHLDVVQDVQTCVEVEPAYARKLIRDAAAYAAGLGLAAAKDTPVVETIFGDVDINDCVETFTFGRDGKPFFVRGPNDTPGRTRAICRTLNESRGVDGWDSMLGVPSEL
jgi:hypothetical protein